MRNMQRATALLLSLLLGILFGGPASTASDPAPPQGPPAAAPEGAGAPRDTVLAPATGPLVLEEGGQGRSLFSILRAFARVTRQQVVMDSRVEELVSNTSVRLQGEVLVPAEEVYTFVEGLLLSQGVLLASVKTGEVPILGVYSLHGNGTNLAPYLSVTPEEAPAYADHPGLLVQTVLELSHTDVRALQTQVRALTRQPSETLIALGSSGMLVRGTGSWVASMTETLQSVDAMSARRSPKPEEAPAQKGD